MYLLLIEIPTIVFICSIIFRMIYSFKIYFAFLITIFSLIVALIYLFGYRISLVGNTIGAIARHVMQHYLK